MVARHGNGILSRAYEALVIVIMASYLVVVERERRGLGVRWFNIAVTLILRKDVGKNLLYLCRLAAASTFIRI